MRFTDRKLGMLLLLLLLSGLVHDETVFEEEESNDDAKEGRANDVNVPKSLGIRMNADQRFATATRKTRFSTSCCCGGGAYVVSLTLQRKGVFRVFRQEQEGASDADSFDFSLHRQQSKKVTW